MDKRDKYRNRLRAKQDIEDKDILISRGPILDDPLGIDSWLSLSIEGKRRELLKRL